MRSGKGFTLETASICPRTPGASGDHHLATMAPPSFCSQNVPQWSNASLEYRRASARTCTFALPLLELK
eukprot:7383594-Pyramimonas_sp.AAC.1